MERQLIADYEQVLEEIAACLSAANHQSAVKLASLPEDIRGFGHVKLAHLAALDGRRKDLLEQLRDPALLSDVA